MADAFDIDDVAAAEALDAEIDRVLGGAARPSTEPIVALLATAIRVEPPVALARRLQTEHARRERIRWRPVQVAAAALAALLLSQGIGNLFNGAWVARGIGEGFSPHTMREGGFALDRPRRRGGRRRDPTDLAAGVGRRRGPGRRGPRDSAAPPRSATSPLAPSCTPPRASSPSPWP